MFEILKAIMALQHAANDHDRILSWNVVHEPGGTIALTSRIEIDEDDEHFVRNMQAMFAPVPS